ncbi:YggT family protein [Acidihalobacter prosperus]
MNAGLQIGQFLINALFSFYIIIVLLRLLLTLVHANFYNPISQFVVSLTNPPLRLLRRVLPPVGRLDTASIVLLLALQAAEVYIMGLLQGITLPAGIVFLVAIRELLLLLVYIYIGAIIIQALMSWVTPMSGSYHPAANLLDSLTSPLLTPIRRVVPLIGMIDLSPLIALLLLNVALILIQNLLG